MTALRRCRGQGRARQRVSEPKSFFMVSELSDLPGHAAFLEGLSLHRARLRVLVTTPPRVGVLIVLIGSPRAFEGVRIVRIAGRHARTVCVGGRAR